MSVLPDRPLSVPLLVRGGFNSGLLVWLAFYGNAFILAGLFALLQPSPEAVAGVFWLIAAGFGVLVLLRALWLLPRRRWLEVTLNGFVLTRRGRRQTFLDADVVGLSRGPPGLT